MGDIGESGNSEWYSPNPVLMKGVGRYFDNGIVDVLLGTAFEELLNLEGRSRGFFGFIYHELTIHCKINGGHHPHFFTRRTKEMFDHMGGGGFSIRARDADHDHFSAGKAEAEGSGKRCGPMPQSTQRVVVADDFTEFVEHGRIIAINGGNSNGC